MGGLPLEIALGFVIGLSLGLLGGGGSILTVPALVYLVGQTPQMAITTSLAIVGANSVLGANFHRLQGTLNWHVALLFGGAGMLISYAAAGLSRHWLSPTLLLVTFAVLMIVIGLLMLRPPPAPGTGDVQLQWPVVLASGAGVGLLTGILGVGGGFLIVPALVMLIGLPMAQAVGTSLLVIAMNSAAGFLGHLGEGAFDWSLVVVFVLAGLAGTFTGSRLAGRLPATRLRRLFAGFVIVLGVLLLIDNMPLLV